VNLRTRIGDLPSSESAAEPGVARLCCKAEFRRGIKEARVPRPISKNDFFEKQAAGYFMAYAIALETRVVPNGLASVCITSCSICLEVTSNHPFEYYLGRYGYAHPAFQ
jgi:hypothetical protein